MKLLSRPAAALVLVALASPCWAGQVKLEIRGGLVTLSAKDASVREILAEWSRVGQTRIVNAERVPGGGLLNLELNGVPEAKALDIVLRSVAGYLAAPRPAGTVAGSRFDRIMIMAVARPASGGASPASTYSAPATPTQLERGRMGGYQPPQAQPSLMVDDQDEPVQPQPQPVTPAMGSQSAPAPGMPTGQPVPVAPGQVPQAPQATPYPPGQQPNSPAAQRPGVMTPAQTPRPPGSPGGGPGGN
jgi:hypothetical protein